MRDKYEVGYKKPPKKSQFKRGKSGNPNGRPKVANDLATALENEMNKRVNVKVNGVNKKLNLWTVVAMKISKAATDTNFRAIELLMKNQRKKVELEEFELTPDDEEALKELEDILMKKNDPS
jgi:hypothetical protein